MKAEKELVSIENVRDKIKEFYRPEIWHFVCINGLFEDGVLKLQWIFTQIGKKEEWKIFCAEAAEDALLPSMSDFLPTARMYEGELKDLLDANFEGSIKGMFIEVDGVSAPLKVKR